jgi:hypothetical protein
LFSGNPPLPRHAEIETAMTPTHPDEVSDIVARAEIFYLPADRIASGRGGGAGARMLAALRRAGAPVAVGWAVIDATEQGALDDWNASRISIDEIASRLSVASSLERDDCRSLLRSSRDAGARSIALRCNDTIAEGSACTADNIVREFRALQSGKLLVIAERRYIEVPRGLPFFVGEKLKVRQLILDSRAVDSGPNRLLTNTSGRLKVVDRAPRASSNRL